MAVKSKPKVARMDVLYNQSIEELVKNNPIYRDIAGPKLLTEAQRKKRERDKARVKMTYDLPTALINEMKKIAESESIPTSQLAHLFLIEGIRNWRLGKIQIEKHASNYSPKYEYALDLPDISRKAKCR